MIEKIKENKLVKKLISKKPKVIFAVTAAILALSQVAVMAEDTTDSGTTAAGTTAAQSFALNFDMTQMFTWAQTILDAMMPVVYVTLGLSLGFIIINALKNAFRI